MLSLDKIVIIPLLTALVLGWTLSGCSSVGDNDTQSTKSTVTSSASTSSMTEKEVDSIAEDELFSPTTEAEPLIIWGEGGVPVFNEKTNEPTQDTDSEKVDTTTSKKKKKKSRKKDEILPGYAEEESEEQAEEKTSKKKPKWTFIVRTNLPLAESPKTTRLQDLYRFNSRVNKRGIVPLPDMVPADSDEQPLFTEDELTSTNAPLRLATAFETKIRLVNDELKFVVLDYSFEPMPPLETRLSVFRGEQRVGSIKITGPVRDGTVIAIILSGSLRMGDTVAREVY